MPTIKDITAKIRKVLGESLTDDVKGLLSDIESEEVSYTEKVKDLTAESVKRKNRINDELVPKIEQLEDQIKKFDADGQKKELESLRAKVKSINDQKRNQWKSLAEQIEKNEKLKPKFVNKEKFEDLTDEEIDANLSKYSEYKDLGLIESTESEPLNTDAGNRFNKKENVEASTGEKLGSIYDKK